jgi:hypothetical protein
MADEGENFVIDERIPEEFLPLVGGEAASTINGKNAAVQQCENMQERRGQPAFGSLSQAYLCCVEFFQVFARFITEVATGRDNKKLMRDTCMQYISGLKNVIFARYPKDDIWKTTSIWYTKLRATVYRSVNVRMIALGLSPQDKNDAIDRSILLKMMILLLLVSFCL